MYYIDKYMYHVHVYIKLVSLFPLKWGIRMFETITSQHGFPPVPGRMIDLEEKMWDA
jgi:hypothetical protein